MGIFDFYHINSPGQGIQKDGPPRSKLAILFGIYTRKFGKLVKLNLLFLLFNIPAIFLLTIISQILFRFQVGDDISTDFTLKFILGTIAVCIPVITVGPAQAGFTYVLRNFAREEHAWIWSDFKEHAIKNLKQSTIVSLIDLVTITIIGISLNMYLTSAGTNFMAQLASAFIIFSLVLFIMMHMYIYPIMVTFNLTIKQIYKNSFLLALSRFFPNLLILVVCAVLIYWPFFNPPLGFIVFALITLSTVGLITNFFAYSSIKKYMMEPEEDNKAKK